MLVPVTARVDPHIKEIMTSALRKGARRAPIEREGVIVVQTAMLNALVIVLKHGEAKAIRKRIIFHLR